MLNVYDAKMNYLYQENKKTVHEKGLWHKVVAAIVYNKNNRCVYFQTIYPKESYTFERPDYIDFSIGGHVEGHETIGEALRREAQEELGLKNIEPFFLGIRICHCDPSNTYHIREFQYFYGINISSTLAEMNFKNSDQEVKSVIEINIEDLLSLILGQTNEIYVNEMLLDKQTREGSYHPHIKLTKDRIIPDYLVDRSILEKLLALKMLIEG